jgi:splicing factor 3B subunit 3
MVPFQDHQGEVLVVVGTGKDATLAPRTSACGFLRVYRMVEEGRALELVHKVRSAIPDTQSVTLSGQGVCLSSFLLL